MHTMPLLCLQAQHHHPSNVTDDNSNWHMHACTHIASAYTHTHTRTHMQGGSEGAGGKGGMPCTLCPHPTCKHSMIKQGVSSCPECDNGTLVLDPVSAPKWRLDCNRCSFLIYLPSELHSAKLSKEHCEVKPASAVCC
jgi:hypothetical protein